MYNNYISAAAHGETMSSARKQNETVPSVKQEERPSTSMTKQKSSSTLNQNADFQHQSLVVIAGNSFSLQCSSPIETTFRWAYCPLGSCGSTIIYNGAIINDKVPLAAKASVSICDGRTCTFDVDNIQTADSGFFTCMRLGIKQYWSVTVLGKPTTWS